MSQLITWRVTSGHCGKSPLCCDAVLKQIGCQCLPLSTLIQGRLVPMATHRASGKAIEMTQIDDADDSRHPCHATGPAAAPHQRRNTSADTANAFCRQASNTVTATALDKFRLRWPANIGSLMVWFAAKDSRTFWLKPLLSEPNTK